MSTQDVVIDEDALLEISKALQNYKIQMEKSFEEALRLIEQNSDNWNDEDYNYFRSSVASLKKDFEDLEMDSNAFCNRIQNKVDAVLKMRGLKI